MSDRMLLNLRADVTHPFLFATATSLERLATNHRDASGKWSPAASKLLSRAAEFVDAPLPDMPTPKDAMDPSGHTVVNQLTDMLTTAAVAWHLDRDARWATLGSRVLAKLLDWPRWLAPNHEPLPADLITGAVSLAMGMGYDLLFDQLDADLKRRTQDVILERAATHLLPENIDRYWWSWAFDGNWSFVTMGGLATGVLAILPERPEALPAVETAAGHLQRSLDHMQPQGGWREGSSYCLYGLPNTQIFADALAAAGEPFLADHPGMTAVEDFLLFARVLPDRPAYFGDSGATGVSNAWVARRAAKSRRGDLLQHVLTHGGSDGPLGVLYHDPTLQPAPVHFDPPSRCFSDIQWAVLRSSWSDPDSIVLATKAGTTAGGHQHPDCGSFFLSAFGKEIIAEPGIGQYSRDYHRGNTPVKSSLAHNCLIFDGQGQVSQEFYGGHITQFMTTAGWDAVKMDLTHCYDHADLRRWYRFFFLLRPGLVVMVDEVRARHGHNQFGGTDVTSRLHTFGKVECRDYDAVISTGDVSAIIKPIVPWCSPGLADHSVYLSTGQHEGLVTRHPDQKGPIPYLDMKGSSQREPMMLVTAIVPGRTLAEAEAVAGAMHIDRQRRHRVEIYYEGQTLVIDWGNRRWETYWNVLPGHLPKMRQSTVGGPFG